MPHTAIVAKESSQWATGAEPMTSRQSWFLKQLCEKAKVEFPADLSKAAASQRIDELRAQLQSAPKAA